MVRRFQSSCVYGSFAAVALLAAAGCGKVPTWDEMNAKPAAPQGKVENVANPQTVDIPSAVTNSLAPLMQEDPAQVLAWFKTVRPMQVNDQALARLTAAKSGLESVTEIDARGGAVTDVGLASLEKLPALQSLALDGTQVTDEGMKALQKVPSLQSLSINGTRISDAGLGSLASLPGLKRLEMMNCDLTPADFAAIGKLPALESLVLNRVLELNDAGLDMICEASTLKSLQINECIAITDKGLVALAKAPGLEELSMNRANITGVGFTAAHGKGGLKSLKSLSVSGVQINLPGAKSINTLKTLESLNIGYVPGLNDQFCVEFVEGLRNLRELNIEASKGVLGQCFSKMKACSNSLETINAQNSGIADQGLGFLRNHKKLKFIDASNTNLTLMGVQQFKKLVPECEILYAGERH